MERAPQNALEGLRIHRPNESIAPRRARGGWLGTLAVVLLLAAAAGWFAWDRWLRFPEVSTGLVRRVEPGKEREVQAASGHVLALHEAKVGAEIAGRLVERNIDVGDRVEAGQVLGRLDHAELDAQIQSVRVRLESAQRELKRQKQLAADRLTEDAKVDEAETTAQSLDADLHVLLVQLDKTYLRAPFAGTVVESTGEVGELLVSGTYGGRPGSEGSGTLCTIADLDSLELEANVAEAGIHRVHDGMPATARFTAIPDHGFPARVVRVLPKADRQRGIVPVRLRLDANDPRVLPGMSVDVTFEREATAQDHVEPYLLVPRAALRQDAGGASCLVVEGVNVRVAWLELGEAEGDSMRVKKGLEGGEHVVVDPPPGLKNGDRIRVRG